MQQVGEASIAESGRYMYLEGKKQALELQWNVLVVWQRVVAFGLFRTPAAPRYTMSSGLLTHLPQLVADFKMAANI